jgi:hypothetical protein
VRLQTIYNCPRNFQLSVVLLSNTVRTPYFRANWVKVCLFGHGRHLHASLPIFYSFYISALRLFSRPLLMRETSFRRLVALRVEVLPNLNNFLHPEYTNYKERRNAEKTSTYVMTKPRRPKSYSPIICILKATNI